MEERRCAMRSVACDVVVEKVGFPSASTDIFARGVIVKCGGSPDTTPRAPQFKRRYMSLCIPFACCYSSRAPPFLSFLYIVCIDGRVDCRDWHEIDHRFCDGWSGGASRTRSIWNDLSFPSKSKILIRSHLVTSVS